MKKIAQNTLLVVLTLLATACANTTTKPVTPPAPPQAKCDCASGAPVQVPAGSKPAEASAEQQKQMAKLSDYSLLQTADWSDIDGLQLDNLSLAWPAWMQSCSTLVNKPMWKNACSAAQKLNSDTASKPPTQAVLSYFQENFSVYKTSNIDGSEQGLITGYYQPVLKGSRTKSAKYPNPLYTTPDDLITVELDSVFPELKYKRVRGRLVGNKLVPYYNRAEIETDASPVKGREFVYIDDIIDVFFLQIQGSGVVQLDTGEQMYVGYADQNGHTYNSIGRLLIERGELTLPQASMQGIKNWARNNLDKLRDLLNQNPSYVFFRELPAGLPGPLGALGVPILAERSVAVDPKFVPLGAPVFLSTTEPNSNKPLKRLMMAQDTGGAIKGGVRADFFWGAGAAAGAKAGAMKQAGKIWVFLPKGFVIKTQ
ncbi:murein transglycosylase A [Methylotenera mobilis]|uniref:peptidoglycan lytic exotransglycosylase n=1 Tax=Methylotenera mobilis (strain JLW8 / ATCC BAA-1282 / DSM 17540) TaxID=583345 RepID=C6WTR3_METML|nr:murein transglycosylase A [Methylotenera mobilis]ACT49204.1 MltA domain protein [Methylotenera mobilis JLW8]